MGSESLKALDDVVRETTQSITNENAQLKQKDNFDRSTPTSVSEKILPQERESLATQLDNMLASVNQSNIPIVPPATAVTPETMLSETILPDPADREILERRMRGTGMGSLA